MAAPPEVQVPVIGQRVEALAPQLALQHAQTVLALTATHDLADAWNIGIHDIYRYAYFMCIYIYI
jgi:hypothetical protein